METLRSIIPVPGFEKDSYDWPARHAEKICWVKENRAKVIFIGDSLTHFWTDESGSGHAEGLWQELFSGESVLNLGYGYDRTQNVLWRMENGELENQHPELIVLNIGTNQFSISENYDGDTPEAAVAGIRKVVETLHERFPAARMVLMALFPRGGKEENITAANRLLLPMAEGWDFVDVIDLTHVLGDAEGRAIPRFYKPDLCHLSRAGYRIWSEALKPYLAKYAGIYTGRLRLVSGDITRLKCDAIVNAANCLLLGGGGVDGAIHRAAGPELLAECRTLNGCRTGEAKVTKGYRLPAKFVIHTVGPVYSGKAEDGFLLRDCYWNSLEEAAGLDLHSVAFPAISTGVYRYPAEEAAVIAVETVCRWLEKHPESDITVSLVAFSEKALNLYQAEWEKRFSK